MALADRTSNPSASQFSASNLSFSETNIMANRNRGPLAFKASMCLGAAAIALLARAPLSRAADADGLTMDEEIKMVPTSGGQANDIKMHVESRGDASKDTMTMTGSGNSTVMLKPGDGRSIMLIPARNMYMVIPAAALPPDAAATSQPAGDVTVTDTGKSQKIDGHDTEGYLVTVKPKDPAGAPHQMTCWMCKDIPDAAKVVEQLNKSPLSPMGGRGARNGGNATANVNIQGMPADAGVPLRIEMAEADNNITVDITNIKYGPIPDADLQVPAGYQDLSTMFGGGGMPAGG
jgi:hypothetical protein